MSKLPTFHTARLVLRPFSLMDAKRVRELAGAYEVAATTANIPHPYEEGMAEEWIGSHCKTFEDGTGLNLAIENKLEGLLVGAIGIHINKANNLGEIGYWIGVPYWNLGYCTEAARVLLKYGFETLGLNRIQARHMTRNPASGRVMQKLGMQHEGTLRQAILRFESYEDVEIYAFLREEFAGS
jgi:RimJ/RimL family protein N-acetyltransferase